MFDRGRSWKEVLSAKASRRRSWHARGRWTSHSLCSCGTVNDRGDDRRERMEVERYGTAVARACGSGVDCGSTLQRPSKGKSWALSTHEAQEKLGSRSGALQHQAKTFTLADEPLANRGV